LPGPSRPRYPAAVVAAAEPGDTAPATAPGATRTPERGACLFLVAQGHDLWAAPARLELADADEVQVVRGAHRELSRRGRTPRHLELALADPRISSRHARLSWVQGRWLIEDRSSRNGTYVNGLKVERAALADGDVIEVGQTICCFRDGVEPTGGGLLVSAPPTPTGLTSLLPAVQRELEQLRAAATTGVTVLLEGETGTGKEVVARALHELSGRRGDLIAINCGGLPRERVAAELFGWKRGAFPGASADHPGLVRAADGGTLFLDEIGDLPIGDQAILLRVLQEREVTPIAATRPIAVDLRVIAATHQPLDALATRDGFRRDLLARLSGFRATLRPLRARREDLGLLLAALLTRRGATAGSVTMHISALRALLTHTWPANVRELEHALAHALRERRPDGMIEAQHLPPSVTAVVPPGNARAAELGSREDLIERLRVHRGNVAAIARDLGKARMQIHRWLKRHDLDPDRFRE
jgi:MoxR-like ATPase